MITRGFVTNSIITRGMAGGSFVRSVKREVIKLLSRVTVRLNLKGVIA